MKTIFRKDKKTTHIHPATVREQLKKLGYRVGATGANGRIRGMSNFYGGNLGVKELQMNRELVERVDGNYRYLYNTIDAYVEVSNHGAYLGEEVDTNEVARSLQGLGYTVEVDGCNIYVTN